MNDEEARALKVTSHFFGRKSQVIDRQRKLQFTKWTKYNKIKSESYRIFIFSKLYSLCVHITSSTKICRMVIWYYHMNECVHLPYSHVMFHRNVMQSPTAVSPRLDLDFVCCVRCWCSGCLVTDSQNNGWIFVWVIFSLLLWLLLS